MLDGVLLFAGEGLNADFGDVELWRSDGTVAGTVLVRDIRPGGVGSHPGAGAVLGDELLFRACTGDAGCELWRTDGTFAGTQRVVDLVPGLESSMPSGLESHAGRVYFSACTLSSGCEPWVTDGTAAGSHRLADIAPGSRSSMGEISPYDAQEKDLFQGAGDFVVFGADDGTGTEPWAVSVEIFYDGVETGDFSRWSSSSPRTASAPSGG